MTPSTVVHSPDLDHGGAYAWEGTLDDLVGYACVQPEVLSSLTVEDVRRLLLDPSAYVE